LERLRRQHKIARNLPPRRARPPQLRVLEPGRRRAARRLSPRLLAVAIVVVAIVAVLVL
jgi:hypothetical protein